MKWNKLILLIFLFLSSFAMAQRLEVNGVVTDENSEPLIGATVAIKGTTIGTITDVNGKFILSVPEKGSILVISFVGYNSQEVIAESEQEIAIALLPDIQSLSEVVVVGYGVQRKSDVTGSITSVSSEKLEKAAVLGVDQALQGKAAGVRVTSNTGSPGSDVSVRIRGINTIGDPDPLYVVDGLPVEGIKFLNPNDIASIEILKDASACAIYGARGSNGVVLITTKKGEKGKGTIRFDSYFGTQTVWKKPDLLNTQEYLMIMNEARENANMNPIDLQYPADDTLRTTDWFDEITRVAPQRNYNLTISGGTETSRYLVSGSLFEQDGVVKGSDYQRLTFRVNSEHKVRDWLTLGNNVSLSSRTRHTINEGDYFDGTMNASIKMDPLTPVRDSMGEFAGSPYTDVKNPVAGIEYSNEEYKNFIIVGNVFAEIRFLEDFSFKSNFGIDFGHYNFYDFDPYYFIAADEQNPISKVTRGYDKDFTWNFVNTINWNKQIGDHSLNALLGTEARRNRYDWFEASRDSLISDDPDMRYLNAGAESGTHLAYGSATEWAMLSYIGRVNYAYKDKYLLTTSIRMDGSSRFGKDNRWGVFPSFSLGWKMDKEDFMQAVPYISSLKLRTGWGQLGNDRIGLYRYASTVNPDGRYTYVLGGPNSEQYVVPGAAPDYFGNDKIKWETGQSTNIGFDAGFFENRLNLTADFFVRRTIEMLIQEPIPEYTGYLSSPYTNGGELRNTGFEFNINYRKKEGEFTYDIDFNFSHAKNKVISLSKDNKPIETGYMRIGYACRTEIDHEAGMFYGYVTDGLFQTQEEIDAYIQPQAIPGDIRFVDLNGDDKIDDQDRTFIGSPFPDFNYGLSLDCAYKGFDLSVFFQGVYGNEIFNFMTFYTMSTDDIWNKDRRILDRWTGPGTSNDVPVMNYKDKNDNKRLSDRYIEDGSYFRLKNIQLGYTIPQQYSRMVNIARLRVYVSGQNLLTFTKYSGLDPEIGKTFGYGDLTNGIDLGTFPQSRLVMFGFNVTL